MTSVKIYGREVDKDHERRFLKAYCHNMVKCQLHADGVGRCGEAQSLMPVVKALGDAYHQVSQLFFLDLSWASHINSFQVLPIYAFSFAAILLKVSLDFLLPLYHEEFHFKAVKGSLFLHSEHVPQPFPSPFFITSDGDDQMISTPVLALTNPMMAMITETPILALTNPKSPFSYWKLKDMFV